MCVCVLGNQTIRNPTVGLAARCAPLTWSSKVGPNPAGYLISAICCNSWRHLLVGSQRSGWDVSVLETHLVSMNDVAIIFRHVTFLCGRAGVYAIGAVVAHYRNHRERRHLFLDLFVEVHSNTYHTIGPYLYRCNNISLICWKWSVQVSGFDAWFLIRYS